MKKLIMGLSSAFVLLGSASAGANEQKCNYLDGLLNEGEFPVQVDEYTERKEYGVSFDKEEGVCNVQLNYFYNSEKFVKKIVSLINPEIYETDPRRLVEMYVYEGENKGERAVRQLIREELEAEYKGLDKDFINIRAKARFTDVGNDTLETVTFDLFK